MFPTRMIRGVLFDFGYVIGYPPASIDRKYLYLDWDGIGNILHDPALAQHVRPGVDLAALEAFFEDEIYHVFLQHEQTDFIDPRSTQLLLKNLPQVFSGPIDQLLVDRLLAHLDTMKFIAIDPQAVEVVAELRRRKFWLGLVSNMMLPGKLLKARLQEAGLLAYFDVVTVSSEAGFIKPHAGIFRTALSHGPWRADEVVFVGDTYQQDILGAQGVGMKTAWLNSRREPHPLAAGTPPDFEINALTDLLVELR